MYNFVYKRHAEILMYDIQSQMKKSKICHNIVCNNKGIQFRNLCCFIDFEKAFDRVDRGKLWNTWDTCPISSNVLRAYIKKTFTLLDLGSNLRKNRHKSR